MKVIAICEMCGGKFSYARKRGRAGRRRLFCDECRAQRNREAVRRSTSKEPMPDDFTDKAETADPIPSPKAYRDAVEVIKLRRDMAVREYVDHLFLKKRMKEMDAADKSAESATVREVIRGVVVETRGRSVIGCRSLSGRISNT